MKNQIFILSICLLSHTTNAQKQLFNGKNLRNWNIYLGSPINGFEELAKKATAESTYQVVEIEGQKWFMFQVISLLH